MSNATGLKSYFIFKNVDWPSMWAATWETIWMTLISMIAVVIFGIILGLILYETRVHNGSLFKVLNWIVGLFVDIFRSIPFIILIVLLLPVTKEMIGTIIGPRAALPSLVISASPFYARMVESYFREVDSGVIEAAESMGATTWEIIIKVLLPESKPALIAGATVTTISLISYTAMAGAIGAGGLGNLAYLDGFQSNNNTVTLVATVIICLFVFLVQYIGDFLVKVTDKRTL
ncbi:methionine ABC transporter permease [Lentilactobacillus farraginis]|uniref:Metal ion ABC superfamily ATP binding cassette transporter, membrane protein n=2 Tax=Lentilactobacillus farraginis DSM 18382 = JCM 14108 TaxID=1423743 RepID=A0A0R1VXA4_9LACO|nr:methionine ABC transporter permease [Lentilactobacillus farraginis]KRM10098.1 metal ion ABC superfamily ATP binding cassette transporter, membrane protein [Lentilactobacillus farraginis DSM 18382 = JCM 14108]